MDHSLEEEYRDFLEIQGLKGQVDIPKAAQELNLSEEDLFEFINERVVKIQDQGFNAQNVGELAGSCFLFAYWLRGVRGQ